MGRKEDNGFKNFIRAWREFRELSQERLGELCGSSGATISRIENGKDTCTVERLQAIAKALDCAVPDLLTRDPNTPADELYREIKTLPEQETQRMVRFVKAWREGEIG